MDHDALESFALAHHGLVTRAAAARAHMSASTWYRAIDRGRLEPLHPGVARLRGTPPTRQQAIAAAVLAAGSGAMASHRSAAFLWGVERPSDDPIDIILDRRGREATLAGVVTHRPRDRRDLSPVLRDGIRCANVLRMLCDLGAVDEPAVHQAVGHVLSAWYARPEDLARAINVHARRGRHGVPAFRRALAEWMLDGKPLDSALEREMHQLLTRYALPPAQFHAVLAGHEVDFWVIGTPVVLECDGWQFHGRTRAQHDADAERDNDLLAAGYVVVRFTFRAIKQRPAAVAARIRAALDRWGPTPAPAA